MLEDRGLPALDRDRHGTCAHATLGRRGSGDDACCALSGNQDKASERSRNAATLPTSCAGRADDELKELGDTFDGLLARLEAAFDAQRQFVASGGARILRAHLA
jgi:hypothetical protein